MKQSQLFTKTRKESPKDEIALNAKLLTRAGFIFKNSAGVYSYLPLGLKVLRKISNIVREEMNKIGGQELLMPSLIEKRYMEGTNRWDLDVGFFAKSKNEKEAGFVLGWSHEEALSAIAEQYVDSYKDLPFYSYQIQTKFRYEARSKSGLLRGREFLMKDLYSFHSSKDDLENYYEKVEKAYFKVFKRCGLDAIYTLADGGVFTENFTHEFQVISDIGEDTIYVCSECKYAENKEITKLKDGDDCPNCGGKVNEYKSIEIGNIFKNDTKYSEPLGLTFKDKEGKENLVWMGSYGIGISRLIGTIAEIFADDSGLVWPESVAPFTFHLIEIGEKEEVKKTAKELYEMLRASDVSVLYDDREKSPGEKFADADLIGIPYQIIIGEKSLEKGVFEFKDRKSGETREIAKEKILDELV